MEGYHGRPGRFPICCKSVSKVWLNVYSRLPLKQKFGIDNYSLLRFAFFCPYKIVRVYMVELKALYTPSVSPSRRSRGSSLYIMPTVNLIFYFPSNLINAPKTGRHIQPPPHLAPTIPLPPSYPDIHNESLSPKHLFRPDHHQPLQHIRNHYPDPYRSRCDVSWHAEAGGMEATHQDRCGFGLC